MTVAQRIIRFVSAQRVKSVLEAHGARQPVVGPVHPDTVRVLADEYRADDEHAGTPLADALLALIVEAETSPVDPWDQPNPTDEHAALFRDWACRLGARSPLLEILAGDLNTLWCAKDPGVTHARRALEVLADADLLLPGVDGSLRPALSVYAGLNPAD